MNDLELASLFLELERFLHGAGPEAGVPAARPDHIRAFWDSRPYITTSELEALAELLGAPLPAEAVALRLRRDLEDTRVFLDALAAVGVLDRAGDRYSATPATGLYLKGVFDRTLEREPPT